VILRALVVGLSVAAIAVVGLSTLIARPNQPEPCDWLFSDAHCLAIKDKVAVDLGLTRADIAAIDVIPEPVVVTRSGGSPLNVRVRLRDGSTTDLSLGCGGLAMASFCQEEPRLRVRDVIGSGYNDTPCTGEPPDGCATPVPSVAPAAAGSATALRIARVDIPIDHVGDYEVRLGEARLPNGLLSVGSFDFVDPWPPDVTILQGGARLVVGSLEPDGRPFVNVYEHGWREGTERVAAFLLFHVDRFDPGATLSIRDVDVR
jgi:hypothetical protein